MGVIEIFKGLTRHDIDADRVLQGPVGTLESAIVAGIDKNGEEYFASSMGSVAETLFLLERFKKMLLETQDD